MVTIKSRKTVFTTNKTTVAPSDTKIINSDDLGTIRGVKYYLTIANETTGKYRNSELMINHDGVTVSYTESSIVGDTLNVVTDIVIDTGKLNFTLNNLESQDVEVIVVRIKFY